MKNDQHINAGDSSAGIQDMFDGKILSVHDQVIEKQVHNYNKQV